ncbi:hypothetical protein D770_16250 [Flammeovirgaceae bacterium 311]|nr:hypothetical protein D770_16250 [Flammeovirgaceae bacterium 311]
MNRSSIIFFLLAACYFTGCVRPYEPPILAEGDNYLVVEGYLAGGSPTTILLSRTSSLSSTEAILPETDAGVTIESQGGATYNLQETAPGAYTSQHLDLDPLDHYRLSVKTKAGKNYLSEFVPFKSTPSIDNISWVQKENFDVDVMLSTQDPENSTRYYQWEFDETWLWLAPHSPIYDYANGKLFAKKDLTDVKCWAHKKDNETVLGSSVKYSSDIISNQLITTIPRNSWKISFRYSILVKQRALTKEAYEYHQQIKKNAEGLGSLFDPQPVELAGNIFSVDDPNEPVIGFFSAGTVQEKRIFIDNTDLTNWEYQWDCDLQIVPLDSIVYYFSIKSLIPVYYDSCKDPNVPCTEQAYGVPSRECTDCSLKANPVEPDFWE